MFHMTTITDDRIRDLHQTAAELRNGRPANPGSGSSPFRGSGSGRHHAPHRGDGAGELGPSSAAASPGH